MKKAYSKEAKSFCESIKALADRPDNLENLESYLTQHFQTWLDRYASTPEDITSELSAFAGIEEGVSK